MTVIHVAQRERGRFGGADSGGKSSPYERSPRSHRISTPEHPEKSPPRRAGNPDRRRMKSEMQRPSRNTPQCARRKARQPGKKEKKTDCRETTNTTGGVSKSPKFSPVCCGGIAPRWRALRMDVSGLHCSVLCCPGFWEYGRPRLRLSQLADDCTARKQASRNVEITTVQPSIDQSASSSCRMASSLRSAASDFVFSCASRSLKCLTRYRRASMRSMAIIPAIPIPAQKPPRPQSHADMSPPSPVALIPERYQCEHNTENQTGNRYADHAHAACSCRGSQISGRRRCSGMPVFSLTAFARSAGIRRYRQRLTRADEHSNSSARRFTPNFLISA